MEFSAKADVDDCLFMNLEDPDFNDINQIYQ